MTSKSTKSSGNATSTTPPTTGSSPSTTAPSTSASTPGTPKPFAVGIVGSRNLGECACSSKAKHWPPTENEKAHQETCPKATEWLRMIKVVGRLLSEHPQLTIVSGGAPGADTLAIDAGKLLGIPERRLKIYPVEKGHGSFAERARLRNQKIVDRADLLIAIFAPGPRSPGTSDTIRRALARGTPTHVWHNGSWSRV